MVFENSINFFLSSKMTNIIARRESLGNLSKFIPSLTATNKTKIIVARLQRAIDFFTNDPAILAGL